MQIAYANRYLLPGVKSRSRSLLIFCNRSHLNEFCNENRNYLIIIQPGLNEDVNGNLEMTKLPILLLVLIKYAH